MVIKADGLALGKGVLICEDEQQAADGVKEIMLDKKFGASGNHVVVEEFLTGPEVSVLSFTDGKVVKPMVSSMDHKRANDHDTGLNTGGMGTVAPNPYYTPAIAAECMEKIFLPTIQAMNAEGCPFKGCLYFGLMLTPDGPKVIEYNCRFGDPETQVVLPLLESDLLPDHAGLHQRHAGGHGSQVLGRCRCLRHSGLRRLPCQLRERQAHLRPRRTASWQGRRTSRSTTPARPSREDGTLVTNGGRVLGVTATADRLTAAITQAYAAAEKISLREAAQADGHRLPGPESNCGKRITAALYNLSVIAARCHLSRSERLWQAVKFIKNAMRSYKTIPLCQGLALWESWTPIGGLRGLRR